MEQPTYVNPIIAGIPLMRPTRELYERAADRLEAAKSLAKRMFLERDFQGNITRLCIHGAVIVEAMGSNAEKWSAYAMNVVRKPLDDARYTTEWNDRIGRTKEEAVAALRQVAATLPSEVEFNPTMSEP